MVKELQPDSTEIPSAEDGFVESVIPLPAGPSRSNCFEEEKTVPDSSCAASSTYKNEPLGSRYVQGSLGSPTAWCAGRSNIGEWWQLNFPKDYVIGVVTQGRADYRMWIKSFHVTSNDNRPKDGGQVGSRPKIGQTNYEGDYIGFFFGNKDQNTPVKNYFRSAVRTSSIRFWPADYEYAIGGRFGLLMCEVYSGPGGYSVCNNVTRGGMCENCASPWKWTPGKKCCPARCNSCDSDGHCQSCDKKYNYATLNGVSKCLCPAGHVEDAAYNPRVVPICRLCARGFSPNEDSSKCVVTDVCADTKNPVCGKDAMCVIQTGARENTDTYSCKCPDFFEFQRISQYFPAGTNTCGAAAIFSKLVKNERMCQNLCDSTDGCRYISVFPDTNAAKTSLLYLTCEGCANAPANAAKSGSTSFEKKITATGFLEMPISDQGSPPTEEEVKVLAMPRFVQVSGFTRFMKVSRRRTPPLAHKAANANSGLQCIGSPLPISSNAFKLSNNEIQVDISKEGKLLQSFGKYSVNIEVYDAQRLKATSLDGFPKTLTAFIGGAKNLPAGNKFKVSLTPYDKHGTAMEPLAATKDVYTLCGCSRNNLTSTGEETGKPDAFSVYQDKGLMRFKWVDTSVCEEGFAFYRVDGSTRVAFTDDYNYASEKQCGGSHAPEFVKEDLKVSKLAVGTTHKYCVYAVSPRPVDPYHSAPACNSVTIKWEAIVHGKVLLDEQAGSLPVANVRIDWSIGKGNVAGNVFTDGDGKFTIHISTDKLTGVAQEITMTPTKKSGEVNHIFKCDKLFQCTSKTMVLNHLDLDSQYTFVDDTSVNFRGAVFVKGTEVPKKAESGCPLLGVEVCLMNHLPPHAKLACSTTDHKGEYQIPAVIGMTVRVNVVTPAANHTFTRIAHTLTANNKPTGTFIDRRNITHEFYQITPKKVWEFVDFHDTSSETLYVQVAGGKCNRLLGDSEIEIGFGACLWKKRVSLKGTSGQWVVPAQQLSVRLVEVKNGHNVLGDVTKIFDTNNLRTQYINLADVPKQARPDIDSENSENSAVRVPGPRPNVNHIRTVRFEYHPPPKLTVKISAAKNIPCRNDTKVPLVIGQRTESEITVFVTEVFGNGVEDCDVVEGHVEVFNHLGETHEAVEQLIKNKDGRFSSRELELLRACVKGCNKTIELENATIAPKKAYVKVLVLTGNVEVNAAIKDTQGVAHPYTKQFRAIYHPAGRKPEELDARVVVTGIDPGEPGDSFPIPEYEPLLVIHDPPGGSSSASYSNAKIHVEMEVDHVDYAKKMTLGLGGWLLGGGNTGSCAGLGFMMCMKMLLAKAEGGLYKDQDFTDEGEYQGDRKARFELTFSYETSSRPENAGKQSDMYLVPALNIMFIKATHISFDYSSCVATSTQVTQWVLTKGGKNREVFAWVSHSDIKQIEIPKLQELLREEKNKTTPDKKKIEKLVEGIAGWSQTLKRNDDLYSDWAKLEKATSYKTGFYTGLAPEDIINNEAKKMALSADELQTAATLQARRRLLTKLGTNSNQQGFLGTVKEKVEGKLSGPLGTAKSMFNLVFPPKEEKLLPKPSPLTAVSSFKFSGGGSKLAYEIDMADSNKKTVFSDGHEDDDFLHDQTSEFTVFGIGVKVKTFLKYDYKKDTKSSPSTEVEKKSRVGFSLGDPDIGDEFTVDVLIDPRYKTFVFHTVAGVSKCPAEPGTKPREVPMITLNGRPAAPPEPNEAAVFHLMILNQASEPSDYELFTLAKSNGDNLVHLIDGSKTSAPISYDQLAPRNGVAAVLEIFRGPLKYKYEPLTVGLRSKCEPTRQATVEVPIEFLQPCSTVQFAANLAEDQYFVMNYSDSIKKLGTNQIRIVARNPENSQRNWTQDTRLVQVIAEYRPHGTLKWMPVRNLMKEVINFAPLESKAGYATGLWDAGPLPDGKYDLQLKTYCRSSGSESDGMDSFATRHFVTGLVDRQSPEQFGAVEPKNNQFFPGDVMAVSFDEPVMCAKPFAFDMGLVVEGVNRTFNKRNMLVVCENRKISVTFTALHQYEEMMGKQATFSVGNVVDLASNELQKPATSTFVFKPINTQAAAVLVENLAFPSKDGDNFQWQFNHADFSHELISLLEIKDPSRLQLLKITNTPNGGYLVDFKIYPAKKENRGAEKTACTLVSRLYNIIEANDEMLLSRHNGGSLLEISSFPHLGRASNKQQGSFVSSVLPSLEDMDAHKALTKASLIQLNIGPHQAPQLATSTQIHFLLGAVCSLLLVVIGGFGILIYIIVAQRKKNEN